MIIIPKYKATVDKLNSYYIDIKKLLEHYQGELGTGVIHLKSTAAEAAIYFDKDEILSTILEGGGTVNRGEDAFKNLEEVVDRQNFNIDIYRISADKIYLWANVPDSQELYRGLSSEFTELESLIKKLREEKFTGFINVTFQNRKEGGIIFFVGGKIESVSTSWELASAEDTEKAVKTLIERTKEMRSVFDVQRIVPKEDKLGIRSDDNDKAKPSKIISILEELLGIFENDINSQGIKGNDFNTLLRKKFLKKAENFPFLDPFAAEFRYNNRKISFSGEAKEDEMVKGLLSCVMEISDEVGVTSKLKTSLGPWYQKNEKVLRRLGIEPL